MVRKSKPVESVPEAIRHVLHSSTQAQLDTCRKGFPWPSDQVTEVRTQKTHVSNLHSIPCRMTGKDSDRGKTGTMVSGKTTYWVIRAGMDRCLLFPSVPVLLGCLLDTGRLRMQSGSFRDRFILSRESSSSSRPGGS